MVNHKEIPPAGASDAVTDDMVERACAAFYSDLAWRTNSSQSRDFMRSALEAALAAQPAPVVGGDWRDCYSRIIKALGSMVTVSTPDKLFDLDAIPRDPIMEQVVRIRQAVDSYGKTLLSARPSATGSNLADKLAALAYKWEEQTRSARLLEATLINKHARELRALLADQPARSYDFSLIARMLRSYSGTTTAYANGDAVEAYALARQLPDAQPAPVVGVTDWTVRLAQDSLSADLAGEGIPLPTYEVMQFITRRALLAARPGGEGNHD